MNLNKLKAIFLSDVYDINNCCLVANELPVFPLTRTKSVQSPASVLRNRKQDQKDIEKEFDLMGAPLAKGSGSRDIQTRNGSVSEFESPDSERVSAAPRWINAE